MFIIFGLFRLDRELQEQQPDISPQLSKTALMETIIRCPFIVNASLLSPDRDNITKNLVQFICDRIGLRRVSAKISGLKDILSNNPMIQTTFKGIECVVFIEHFSVFHMLPHGKCRLFYSSTQVASGDNIETFVKELARSHGQDRHALVTQSPLRIQHHTRQFMKHLENVVQKRNNRARLSSFINSYPSNQSPYLMRTMQNQKRWFFDELAEEWTHGQIPQEDIKQEFDDVIVRCQSILETIPATNATEEIIHHVGKCMVQDLLPESTVDMHLVFIVRTRKMSLISCCMALTPDDGLIKTSLRESQWLIHNLDC